MRVRVAGDDPPPVGVAAAEAWLDVLLLAGCVTLASIEVGSRFALQWTRQLGDGA